MCYEESRYFEYIHYDLNPLLILLIKFIEKKITLLVRLNNLNKEKTKYAHIRLQMLRL